MTYQRAWLLLQKPNSRCDWSVLNYLVSILLGRRSRALGSERVILFSNLESNSRPAIIKAGRVRVMKREKKVRS